MRACYACRVASGLVTPRVSVIIPVLNEAGEIGVCLNSLESQDYAGEIEILVADGGSTDGTLQVLDGRDVVLVPNPDRVQSLGFNRAARVATGEVLVRADAHSVYPADYVRRSLEVLLETGASAVGGPLEPAGTTRFGEAVARAMRARLAVGPAPFHHARERMEVDTVYLGTFRRQEFLDMGGMRALPSGVAEDADLFWRWRRAGGRVVLDPGIRTVYRPRQDPVALWRQFSRYGAGKADMLFVNGRWPSWRPVAPVGLVLALLVGFAWGMAHSWLPLSFFLLLWLTVLAVAARGRLLVMVAAGIMHLSYGTGLLRGLLRWPPAVRAAVRS